MPDKRDSVDRQYLVYVCDSCGSITDAHGEPVGCVNTSCSEPTMRPATVVEVPGIEEQPHAR